jgi:prepilin peptidase CpaA
MTSSIVPFVTLAVAAIAMVTDLRSRRVPNALTLGAAAAALLYHALVGGWSGLGIALGGWIVGAALFFPIFALGGMGAGDVKLVAALGAWLGPLGAMHVALGAALAGGALAVLLTLRLGYLQSALRNLARLMNHWRSEGVTPMPGLTLRDSASPRLAYAVPIFVGTLGALWLA